MMKAGCLVLTMCLLCTALTSCYGAKELDNWAYVHTIGVDKGVSDKLRFTVQIPTVKEGKGGGGGGQKASESQEKKDFTVISIDCPTLSAGANMINVSLAKTLNYMHAKYIVISEDLAREGVDWFINGIVRSRHIRRIMYVIVVKGSASEFVKELDPVLGIAVSKFQEQMMDQGDRTSLFSRVTYNEFINDMKSTYKHPVAAMAAINDFSHYKPAGSEPKGFKSLGVYYGGELPRSGGNKFEFLGTALFDGDKLAGELNGDETRAMLMIKGEFERGSFVVIPSPHEPDLRISIDTRKKKKPNIRISFSEGKPVIHVKVFLEGEIENSQSKINYESEKLKPYLEESLKARIKDILDRTIDKCKGLNIDVFGFGEKASMQFWTIQEWEEYNWLKNFKDAEITTEVDFIVRRTGTMIRTNPTRTTEGQK